MQRIVLKTVIRAPVERCFDLSGSTDLLKVSTEHTNEEAVDGVTSGLIKLNEFVTWRAKHFGIYRISPQRSLNLTVRDSLLMKWSKELLRDLDMSINNLKLPPKIVFEDLGVDY